MLSSKNEEFLDREVDPLFEEKTLNDSLDTDDKLDPEQEKKYITNMTIKERRKF